MRTTLKWLAAALSLVLAGCASGPQVSFAIIGDMGYRASEEPLLENVLREVNAAPLAFVVHVGDLGSPLAGSCTDELLAKRLAQFQASAHPLIYTPGDNEWTDCHDGQGVKGGNPLQRLPVVRGMFFKDGQSLGQRKLPLVRQSGTYPENARWELGGVTFLTLHVVGSNNGLGRTPDGDEEHAKRRDATLAWLREGFADAKATAARAVMVILHANMYPELPPFPGEGPKQPSGFAEVRAALEKEARAFGRPVVLVHGDSHYFRVDKPLMIRRAGGAPLASFTRIEGFGSPFHHWVHVSIDPRDPEVFVVRPRIVEANTR
jgi:hypothetical protein